MKMVVLIACSMLLACSNGGSSSGSKGSDSPQMRQDSNPPPSPVPHNDLSAVDVSPLDISYFPVDYPVRHMQGELSEGPFARVIYSRPHMGGRVIFGGLLKYGEPWRLGANEATELELFRPMSVQGRAIPVGRYVLYCIPGPNDWVIVFNKKLYTWGLHSDPSEDAFRFTVPVSKGEMSLEHFTMVFQETAEGADLVIGWDDVRTRLPFVFSTKKHS